MPLPRVALTLTRHSTGCSNCSRILASEQYTWEPDFSRSSTAEPATHLEAYGNHSRFVLLQFSGRLFPICLAACFTPERDITAAANLSRLGPPPRRRKEKPVAPRVSAFDVLLCDTLTSRALSQPTRGSEPGTCLATKLRCCLSGPRRPSYS